MLLCNTSIIMWVERERAKRWKILDMNGGFKTGYRSDASWRAEGFAPPFVCALRLTWSEYELIMKLLRSGIEASKEDPESVRALEAKIASQTAHLLKAGR
jgi:hypothetical protein